MRNKQLLVDTKKMEALVNYFTDAKQDPSRLQELSEDPIKVLKSVGVPVEAEFQEAVAQQLSTHADLEMASQASEETAASQEASVVVTPKAHKVKMAATAPPEEGIPQWGKDFKILLKPWGLVLAVNTITLKYLSQEGSKGADKLAGILADFASLLRLPLLDVAIKIIFATALKGQLMLMHAIDKGKGVYLTWTWFQLNPFIVPPTLPNPMYGIPVTTPIK